MAHKRQTTPFERLLSEPVRNGIYKVKEFHGRGAKIVNMGELFAHPRLRSVPMKRVELSGSERERFMLSKGDLLFARRSLVAEGAGKCIIVLDVDEPTTFESSIIRARLDASKVEPMYLYYFFNSTLGLHALDTIRRQVAVSGITGRDLQRLEIPVPSLSEQRAIAHILGTLDDKIELNRRMNETLEATAQAFFKSWFVDGVEDGAPNQWRIDSLDRVATFLNGLALQRFPPNGPDSLPVIKIAQLRSGNTEGSDKASARIDPAYIIEDGDVLFSWSGSLEVVLWCGGRGALNQHLFKISSSEFPKWFYYLWTKQHLPEFQGIAAGKATTMGHIQRHHLTDARVFIPSRNDLDEMTAKISPLIEKIIANNIESRTLTELRDALLPMLMSGQLLIEIG